MPIGSFDFSSVVFSGIVNVSEDYDFLNLTICKPSVSTILLISQTAAARWDSIKAKAMPNFFIGCLFSSTKTPELESPSRKNGSSSLMFSIA